MKREFGKSVRRIVLKVGSAALSTSGGQLDYQYIGKLARQIAEEMEHGIQVLLVTSGAVSAGLGELNLTERPRQLVAKQALASIGQGKLMHIYSEAFGKHGRKIAQLLLTRQDMEDRRRYLNARGTLEELLKRGVVPIINENDTVTVDELKFGDNDFLSAIVAIKIGAQLLVIFSDVDGVYEHDPRKFPEASVISEIGLVTEDVRALARKTPSKLGSGGMASKLFAAGQAMQAGIGAVILNAREPDALSRVLKGEPLGTYFPPRGAARHRDRDHWIAFAASTRDKRIVVDDGAKKALMQGHKSLLPAGVLEVLGEFKKGEVAEVCAPDGIRFAKGICRYDAAELHKIKGLKSSDLKKIFNMSDVPEVIHCDDLVIIETELEG